MKPTHWRAVCAAVVIVAWAVPVAADQSCKPVVGHFEAFVVPPIFLKSGDTLLGTDTGSIDLPPGQGGFASLITFDGGTGAMSGATGRIRLRGEFSASEGTTSGDYIGTLCAP